MQGTPRISDLVDGSRTLRRSWGDPAPDRSLERCTGLPRADPPEKTGGCDRRPSLVPSPGEEGKHLLCHLPRYNQHGHCDDHRSYERSFYGPLHGRLHEETPLRLQPTLVCLCLPDKMKKKKKKKKRKRKRKRRRGGRAGGRERGRDRRRGRGRGRSSPLSQPRLLPNTASTAHPKLTRTRCHQNAPASSYHSCP